MHFSTWLVFCGVALLLSFTPGPAVLLAISNSVALGPRRAMVSSLGNALGLFLVSAVAMAGLGVVLAASATAFLVLKLAGAGYLVFLGIRQWRSRASAFAEPLAAPGASAATASARRLFARGLTVALTNPKSILFFSALFPQFLTPDAPIAVQFLVLTSTFMACSVFSHACYVLLARMLKRQFASPLRSRVFNRVCGAAFVGLGLGVLRLRAGGA